MRRARAIALSLLAPALLACGSPGDARYAGMRVHEPDDGSYRVRFLSPPWELVDHEGRRAVIEIPANATGFIDRDAGIPPKYRLVVDVVGGSAASVSGADAASAAARGETIVEPLRAIETDSGAMGFEVITRGTDASPRSFRYVSFDAPAGVVHLVFEASPELDEPEVDAMVRAVEVGPFE